MLDLTSLRSGAQQLRHGGRNVVQFESNGNVASQSFLCSIAVLSYDALVWTSLADGLEVRGSNISRSTGSTASLVTAVR